MNIQETLAEDTGNSIQDMLAGTLEVITPDNVRNYVPEYSDGVHADIDDLIQSSGTTIEDWTVEQEGTALVFKYKGIEKWRLTI